MGSRKVFGIGTFTQGASVLALASCAIALPACGQGRGEPSRAQESVEVSTTQAKLDVAGQTVRYAHGVPSATGKEALGYRKAVTEHLAVGAPSVAVDAKGRVLVLDALKGRVLRLFRNEVEPVVTNLPKDCDDLAVGADGAFAVRRSVKPEVLVFAPDGRKIGSVDTSAVETTDSIALLASRRVAVTTPFQETFAFGSPSFPQVPEAVLHGKREGAAFLPNGDGIVAVKKDDGVLELRIVANGASAEAAQETRVKKAVSLGTGSSARIVGSNGGVVCARIEHAHEGAGGEVLVDREAACVDVVAGRTLLRTKLPDVGTYVPRHELAFRGSTLVHMRPTDDGLDITTWSLEAGSNVGGAQ